MQTINQTRHISSVRARIRNMTVAESIVKGLRGLSLRQQVEIASQVFKLSADAQKERAEILQRTHGCLSEADGQAFEEAMLSSRKVETNG